MDATADLKTLALQEYIIDEVTKAMGFPVQSAIRNLVDWALKKPSFRFANMMASADTAFEQGGVELAATSVLEHLKIKVLARGREHLPTAGPLLIASNHPAAYDSVCIAAQVPRDDLKVLASGVNFLKRLEALQRALILVSYNQPERFKSIYQLIDQLESGGALLHFGSGTHDPDPETQPGSLEQVSLWHRTLEVLLRKVPETRLCLTAVSGVLEPKYLRNPITWLRRQPKDKRRLAEMMEIASLLITGRAPKQTVHISFAAPVTLAELESGGGKMAVIETIKALQRTLLQDHLGWLASLGRPAYC